MTDCRCQEPPNRERVEFMLRTAKTKADLQELVRALDARNLRLQEVRDQLGIQLAQARLNGRTPQ